MKPQDLAARCIDSIDFARETELPMEDASITLTLPMGWKPPPKFPRGYLAQVKPDGRKIRIFKAMNVLAWLAGNDMINLEVNLT
jgi:hypothetical protein